MIELFDPNKSFNGIMSCSMSKTLYHGTTIDHARDIERYGLVPQTGNFTKTFYDDDIDEDGNDNTLEELVFATDKDELNRALTAMVAQVGIKLNKEMHSVTDDEILRNGALVIIREGDWTQRPKEQSDGWDMDHQDGSHNHVEPGDYYSDALSEPISFILTGNKMIELLRQMGVMPRTWGPNEKQNEREIFIKYVRLKHPEIPVDKVIEKVDSLERTEFREFFNSYVPKEVRMRR